jgi:hypothetical protein
LGNIIYPSAGSLDQRLEVLELREQDGTYSWKSMRKTWAKAELSGRTVFSVHSVGADGVKFTLRRQPISLESALRWRDWHCCIVGIEPLGRLHMQVSAALVRVSDCEDKYTGTKFPAVVTEKYLGHSQEEPQAINVLRHVLVTPKAIELTPGNLVEVEDVAWPIQTAHLLDPWKNEYEIERTVDL